MELKLSWIELSSCWCETVPPSGSTRKLRSRVGSALEWRARERKLIMEIWGRTPSGSPGVAQPRWGSRGKAPKSWLHLSTGAHFLRSSGGIFDIFPHSDKNIWPIKLRYSSTKCLHNTLLNYIAIQQQNNLKFNFWLGLYKRQSRSPSKANLSTTEGGLDETSCIIAHAIANIIWENDASRSCTAMDSVMQWYKCITL